MANSIKGETTLGDYTLAFNFGTFCQLEDKTRLKVPDLLQAMQVGLGFNELKDFVWAGLRQHHPEMTDEDVIALLNEQGFAEGSAAVARGVSSFFGEPKAKDKNPTKSSQ